MIQSYLPAQAKHSLASVIPLRRLFCIAGLLPEKTGGSAARSSGDSSKLAGKSFGEKDKVAAAQPDEKRQVVYCLSLLSVITSPHSPHWWVEA